MPEENAARVLFPSRAVIEESIIRPR